MQTVVTTLFMYAIIVHLLSPVSSSVPPVAPLPKTPNSFPCTVYSTVYCDLGPLAFSNTPLSHILQEHVILITHRKVHNIERGATRRLLPAIHFCPRFEATSSAECAFCGKTVFHQQIANTNEILHCGWYFRVCDLTVTERRTFESFAAVVRERERQRLFIVTVPGHVDDTSTFQLAMVPLLSLCTCPPQERHAEPVSLVTQSYQGHHK